MDTIESNINQTDTLKNKTFKRSSNGIADALSFLGWMVIIIGIAVSIAMGIMGDSSSGGGFSWSLFFILLASSLISGVVLLGFSEVITLLEEIKKRLRNADSK